MYLVISDRSNLPRLKVFISWCFLLLDFGTIKVKIAGNFSYIELSIFVCVNLNKIF